MPDMLLTQSLVGLFGTLQEPHMYLAVMNFSFRTVFLKEQNKSG